MMFSVCGLSPLHHNTCTNIAQKVWDPMLSLKQLQYIVDGRHQLIHRGRQAPSGSPFNTDTKLGGKLGFKVLSIYHGPVILLSFFFKFW